MKDLYYTGDAINLSYSVTPRLSVKVGEDPPFGIRNNNTESTRLTKINVNVFSNEGEIVHEDPVMVVDNVVKYSLNGEMTKHSGDYAAFFNMVFANGQPKTYKVVFTVLPRNLDIDKKEVSQTTQLTVDSSEGDIETALGTDIRNTRRAGGNTKTVFDVAQEKVGRRLPK